jgi:hypothetical protein
MFVARDEFAHTHTNTHTHTHTHTHTVYTHMCTINQGLLGTLVMHESLASISTLSPIKECKCLVNIGMPT